MKLHMKLFNLHKKQKQNLPALVAEISNHSDDNLNAHLFIQIVDYLRPNKEESADQNMVLLIEALESNSTFQEAMQRIFSYLFNNRDVESLFAEVGIQPQSSFIGELIRQINHIILPPLPEKRTMTSLLQQAFWKKNDDKWVTSISDEHWICFFKHVYAHGQGLTGKENFQTSMLMALQKLTLSVSQVGLDDHVSRQLTSNNALLHPFFDQVGEMEEFIFLIKHGASAKEILAVADRWRKIEAECEAILVNIKEEADKYGTSIDQTYLLTRSMEQLIRMRVIVRFLSNVDIPEQTWQFSIHMFKEIVESINQQNSVRALYKKNAGMLAYQIAEQKSHSGEHYITTTRKEYWKFFASACAGGFIISFAGLFKVLLHHVEMPEFWQFFCYGLNYALAFVILFITGATLATKQPAMTASALARGLDSKKNKGEISFSNTALLFGKVWRSQFASFAGNLLIVFPLCFMMSYLWHLVTGHSLFPTMEDAFKNMHDQNPTKSLAWLYACITGVALFISGIINGYMDNKALYISLGARIKAHPFLKNRIAAAKLDKIGDYVQKNIGGIIGNICLGFMLGFAPLIGIFFGIPFDIRHITISTAYFGFGVETLHAHMPLNEWIWTTVGVLGIGFLNFAVSFSLAFYVAMQSRQVSLKSIPKVAKFVTIYFFRKPWDFIFPPRKERKASDIFKN